MARPNDLSGLEAAIGGAIDEISDDGVASRGVEFPAKEEAPKEDGADDEPSPDKETPSPDEADADGEETPSPEGEEEAAAEKDLLEGFSESKRKALLKFAPGGKITTAEELEAAEGKFVDDYWRNHTRLADAAREEKPPVKEEPPPDAPAKKEVEVAPAIARIDKDMQTIVVKANHAEEQKKGWQEELSKKTGELNALRRRSQSGDSTVDQNEILRLYEEVEEARGHISGWEREWGKLSDNYQSALARKQEVQTILDVRDRLDRQEKAEKDRQQGQAQQAYERNVAGAVSFVTTPAKAGEQALVPTTEKERFGKYLDFAIGEHFRNNPNATIPDLHVFAADVAKTFMGPVIAARTKAMETYNKDKAGDAPPKPTVPKKKPGAPAARTKKDGPSSMADLESLVTGHSGWNG